MGKYSVLTLPIAEQDIHGATLYLAEQEPAAALAFLEGLEEIEEQLSDYPASGAPVQDKIYAQKGYRFKVVSRYYVFYTFRDDVVWIARVIHSRRDYTKLL